LEKQDLLKKELRKPGLKFNWSGLNDTLFEIALSRGDRRLSNVIYNAWKNGAKFDAWHEHFNWDIWLDAFEQAGLDPDFYTSRQLNTEDILPWDHISTAVKPDYLLKEFHNSAAGETTDDCREKCYACGILPEFNDLRRVNPGDHWKCPEVAPKRKTEVSE